MVNNHCLKYESPAYEWIEGLPLGNGTIGAMVFGKPGNEVLSLNHDRLWRNSISKEVNTAGIIPRIRELCLQGEAGEAEKILKEATKDGPDPVNSFQPFGDLALQVEGVEAFSQYTRLLDMQEGVAYISFIAKNIAYHYECFISEEFNALFLKISCDMPGMLNCRFVLSRTDDPECSISKFVSENLYVMMGRFVEGIVFTAAVDISLTNGNKQICNENILVSNADEIVLRLSLSKGYNSADPLEDCRTTLENIKCSFESAKRNHVLNQRKYFDRVSFGLNTESNNKTIEEIFLQLSDSVEIDSIIYEQMFQMARYLVIGSSRLGTMPLNLQGVWNNSIAPEWDCSYTMDMNMQMHYWLTLPCNLFECQTPVFDWIDNGLDIQKKLAGSIFGCRGVFIPQYTDFKFTPYKGYFAPIQLLWSGAATWIAQHYYEHWKYTADEEFLLKRAYPYMKECAKFYSDFIVKDENGKYIVCPSCSPENKTINDIWLVNTATMDITLINELLGNLTSISIRYNIDEEERKVWEDIRRNLIPYPIDKDGALREWVEDVDMLDPYHRHISHIYGIFPGKLFESEESIELYEAAVKAIYKRREGGFGSFTSWSHAWYACCFARIGNGDAALDCIDDIVKSCMMNNYLTTHEDCRGLGLTSNHFDHKIFQADAILGAAGAISEMLIQSFDSAIRILPALPSRWHTGIVKGLRAYNGFELDIEWMDGKIVQVKVISHMGGIFSFKLCIPHPAINPQYRNASVVFSQNEKGIMSFNTIKGEVYTLF